MRRVAEAVGITPMAIYHHFPNRDSLLNSVTDREFAKFLGYIGGGQCWVRTSEDWSAQWRRISTMPWTARASLIMSFRNRGLLRGVIRKIFASAVHRH